MHDAKEMFLSPTWWVTVVIAGIVINLMAAYLKRALDASLSRMSQWWRVRSEKQKSQRQAFVAKMRADSHEQVMVTMMDLRYRYRAIHWLLVGVFLMISVQVQELRVILPYIFKTTVLLAAAFSFFQSYRMHQKALYILKAFYDAVADHENKHRVP